MHLGSAKDEVVRFFLGGSTELSEVDFISNSAERYRLKTLSSGIVNIELGVLLKNFNKFGVEAY